MSASADRRGATEAAGEAISTQLLVLGAGPGGYTAAFRAADLGLDVTLVERHHTLGGVCLNVGCIPSKALLHIAKTIADAQSATAQGISFSEPEIDLERLRAWKQGVVGKLTDGLSGMARQRKVRVLHGEGRFTDANTLTVGASTVTFEHAILATGSSAVRLPDIPYGDERVMDSTAALELADIPARLLVIGGGVIGLELATVYDALGSQVTVVEFTDELIPGCDRDLVKPLQRRISERYTDIHLGTRVASIDASEDGLHATFAAVGDGASSTPQPAVFDRVLVAAGRTPNSEDLGLEAAGVKVDERGFVTVDSQCRTSASHIHAIGDLVGQPMLAHKATHEAKVAAEAIAGEDVEIDFHAIPSVAYTHPEIAWVGLTENEAKRDGTPYRRVSFPWAASGRALASDAQEGMTKLLVDPHSNRLLGAGIVGENAGELIAEVGLALELEVDTQDIALTVHAHPTLAESVAVAAEIAEGTVTDMPPARR
jgi:dihydrolipoamide dehydrogenase